MQDNNIGRVCYPFQVFRSCAHRKLLPYLSINKNDKRQSELFFLNNNFDCFFLNFNDDDDYYYYYYYLLPRPGDRYCFWFRHALSCVCRETVNIIGNVIVCYIFGAKLCQNPHQ